MRSPLPLSGDRSRRGITLLEILLVLGVMVVVAATTFPSILRALDGYRLKRAAEDVRIEMHATRTRAIESGLMYQFLYEPGGTKFLSVPAEHDGAAPNHRTGVATSAATDDLPRHFGELPAGFVFHTPAVAVTSTSALASQRKLIPELLAGLDDARNLGSIAWSSPILFDADGTGDDGEVQLVDTTHHQAIPVSVRGFTGVLTVGKIERGVTP